MTNKNKLNILLVFGGRSDEHDVSIISASNIIPHFDQSKYNLNLLYITKEGGWLLCDESRFKLNCDFPEQIKSTIKGVSAYVPIGQGDLKNIFIKKTDQPVQVDLVFNVLHGRNGAGGVLQGVWDTLGIVSVCPSLIGGVIGFDKDIMKRLLSDAGIPICRYKVVHKNDYKPSCIEEIKKNFQFPFFIKPANSGSSLGVHKIYKESEFEEGVTDVFSYDNKLIVEEYIDGSELEVYCFFSEDNVQTSVIRQTIIGAEHDFYTYEAKYGVDNATTNIKNIPADIPKDDYDEALSLSIQAYKALEGRGEIRMDLFYSGDKKIYINEINTIPSLMSAQSQPSLWHGCGLSHGEIIDKLISQAIK